MHPLCPTEVACTITLAQNLLEVPRELTAEVTLTSLQVLPQKSNLMEVATCRMRSLTSHYVVWGKALEISLGAAECS